MRQTGPGRWLARCPGHADKSPCLSILEKEDGRILAHCFAGCSIDEITRGAGIEIQDLFPDKIKADYVKGERRPFPASDVLRAVAEEAQLVAVAACNLGQGLELTAEDRERLMLASERIQQARRLSLGQL